ncbi:MAG: two-component system sensor histidine kinase NtrB [Caulobacteraceae bacterium]
MTATPSADAGGLKAAAFDLNPEPVLVLDPAGALAAANEAAQVLFGQGFALLARGRFTDALAPGCGLATLIERCRAAAGPVRDRSMEIGLLGHPSFEAEVAAAPMGDGSVLLNLRPRGSALGSERPGETVGLHSAAGLGRMLAHEIKNPLAGIRGAAQLLKSGANVEDVPLAQLIIDETDRVHRLVDRMEAFSEGSAPRRKPVNIHRVLDRVRALAASGLADGLTLRENYDPSLPPAWGEEDQLIQLFLNLVKNAAEAAHGRGDGRGEIAISTAYRHGMRVRAGHGGGLAEAPLEVRVADNGLGAPAELREHLFEPFVTTKPTGAGLGLALVAKVAAAHDGLVDFESEPGRTVFRVLLPVARGPRALESA